MATNTPIKYRAEQVGSLLRPPDLLDARRAFDAGQLTLDALQPLEDRAIRQVLDRQRSIGLDILSDGELRRGSWLSGMAEAVDGFVPDHMLLEWKGPGGAIEPTKARVAGSKLRKVSKLTGREVPFLQQHAGGPFKVTLPAPSNFVLSSFKEGITDRVYPDRAALLADVVEIVRDEVAWLVSQGVVYVQLDAPYYSHYVDAGQREKLRADGFEPDRELAQAIAGDSAVFDDVPASVTRALHVCRGNNQSRWYTEGAYDGIAEQLFGTMNVDRFLLEYDDERSGGFQPLRRVPPGKVAVLGLLTSKRPGLEPVDVVRRRIDEAARELPLEQLALSPQCGFASILQGNRLGVDDQWRKLERVVEVARQTWG